MTTTTSMPHLLPLTLIVATTPTLGIGFRNTLPWPRLQADLTFFARVTKRPPPPPPPPTSPTPASARKTKNAVIMGRKTWDSLPPNVRPLKGRINIVVSRTPQTLQLPDKEAGQEPIIVASSIDEALRKLQSTYPPQPHRVPPPPDPGAAAQMSQAARDPPCPAPAAALAPPSPPTQESQAAQELPQEPPPSSLGRVFVIGGAEIYKSALEMECCERILWTRVGGEWECDVFFPGGVLGVEGEDGGRGGGDRGGKGIGRWVERSTGELEAWVGEEGVGGVRREGDVEFEVRMVEREGG